jgi:Pro-kumamolisin, activation domain/Putative Ig domain
MSRGACRLLLASLAVLATLVGVAASAGAVSVRPGAWPTLPRGASLIGELAPNTPLHITVAMSPRDPAALERFATAVSTPGAPAYGHVITPAQFARRFGPTRAQVAAVRRSLRAHGLTPGPLSANGLSLPVRASAGVVERAFALMLVKLRLPGGGSVVVSDLAPRLDPGIAGTVQAVLGLSSSSGLHPLNLRPSTLAGWTTRPRPSARSHVATGGPHPCAAASSAARGQGAHTADQIASAYGMSGLYRAGNLARGVTVALYELEPNDPGDVATYASCYGVHPAMSYESVDGGVGSGAGSGEAALDIEQVVGLAPQAKLIVYQGPNSDSSAPGAGPYDTFAAIVNENRARVVSVSWGQCENLEGAADAGAENTLFQEAAAQGQSILAASGDAGSEDCDAGGLIPNVALAVDDPGSQPFVTSVGGTSLTALGPPPTESVWNNGGNLGGLVGPQPGAGGGGISALWPMPAYQSNVPPSLGVARMASGTPCHANGSLCREVPDVSADADPNTGYLIFYNGAGSLSNMPSGWQATAGTSASAPIWAAVVALADASKACGGLPVGFANPAIYDAATANYSGSFHDVTAGNNDFTGSNHGLYPAEAGFDLASGFGSPKAATLAARLCAGALRLIPPATQDSTVHTTVRLALRVAGAAGSHVTFSATGLPAGLAVNGSTGTISGRPKRRGRSSVHVVASEPSGGVRTAAFTWVIGAAPRLSAASVTRIGSGHPTLHFAVAAGKDAPALRALTVRLAAGLHFTGTQSITVAGPHRRSLRVRARLVHGALVLTLHSAVRTVAVSVGSLSLSASQQLVASVSTHRNRRAKLRVSAGDAGGGTTALSTGARLRG